MKIHWGTGIIIAFIAFISFIMYFIIKMHTNDQLDHDLVTDAYYQEELIYQQTIDKETNAKTLAESVTWQRTKDGLLIVFPKTQQYNKITGHVFLYRPSDKQLDFETTISLSDHNLLIPDKRLLDGRWNIHVNWQYEGKSYLYKKEIVY